MVTGSDWRDGFLFVGNHLALDFLNTRPVMDGEEVELLPDAGALARWIYAAGLITRPQSAPLERRWSAPVFARALKEFWKLRENFRKVVFQMEGGEPLFAGFIKELNQLLIAHPYLDQVVRADAGYMRRKWFAPEIPEELFAPLADSIATLLTQADRSRIRKCRTCVLHFYDTSKKKTRLWCSMKICGNRSKVAAHAQRQRASAERDE